MADNDRADADEDTCTLQEAMEIQEMLENQSTAVLGALDPQNCSYPKGYMKRQALYACLTCNPKGAPFAQRAGVCLACSYTCHEGHELVELFTKRQFRCDCGNKKFPDNPCLLTPEKDETNSENVYNQNFDGVYCSCHRPYPDPDKSELADDPMIQCIVCEDWHHSQHSMKYLNMDFATMDEDYELICGPCMGNLKFLAHYSELAFKPAVVEVEVVDPVASDSDKDGVAAATAEVKVKEDAPVSTKEIENENPAAVSIPRPTDVILADEKQEKSKPHVEDTASSDSGVVCSLDANANATGGESSTDVPMPTGTCPLLKNAKGDLPFSDVNGIVWKGTLRSQLCRCATCMTMYEELKISYLLDKEDTIEHYEAIGREKAEAAQLSAEAKINDQVNQLGRVGQLEFIHGVNEFKEQLSEFMKRHAENGTVIQREDVTNFFAMIKEEQSAKRRRLE